MAKNNGKVEKAGDLAIVGTGVALPAAIVAGAPAVVAVVVIGGAVFGCCKAYKLLKNKKGK